MTKYQESTFKNYVQSIEDLSGDYRELLREAMENGMDINDDVRDKFQELRKVRIEFIKWFQHQIKK